MLWLHVAFWSLRLQVALLCARSVAVSYACAPSADAALALSMLFDFFLLFYTSN
jgi:hypothetical protein